VDAVKLVLGLINAETDAETLDVDIHAFICSNKRLRHKVGMQLSRTRGTECSNMCSICRCR